MGSPIRFTITTSRLMQYALHHHCKITGKSVSGAINDILAGALGEEMEAVKPLVDSLGTNKPSRLGKTSGGLQGDME